jgi:hypothetical protein
LQTPQRNAGLAATDDTLLHRLPITGGNNHTLVAQINNYPLSPINTSQSAYHVLHIKYDEKERYINNNPIRWSELLFQDIMAHFLTDRILTSKPDTDKTGKLIYWERM